MEKIDGYDGEWILEKKRNRGSVKSKKVIEITEREEGHEWSTVWRRS